MEEQFKHIQSQKIDINESNSEEVFSQNSIVKRNYEGPLPFKRLMSPNRPPASLLRVFSLLQKDYGGIIIEFLNLVSGMRSIEDIYLLLKITYHDLKFDDFDFILNLLLEEEIISQV